MIGLIWGEGENLMSPPPIVPCLIGSAYYISYTTVCILHAGGVDQRVLNLHVLCKK